eukprot:358814-Chlamydomonas_euryale.AAC.2
MLTDAAGIRDANSSASVCTSADAAAVPPPPPGLGTARCLAGAWSGCAAGLALLVLSPPPAAETAGATSAAAAAAPSAPASAAELFVSPSPHSRAEIVPALPRGAACAAAAGSLW